jgi:hypothetical protein
MDRARNMGRLIGILAAAIDRRADVEHEQGAITEPCSKPLGGNQR